MGLFKSQILNKKVALFSQWINSIKQWTTLLIVIFIWFWFIVDIIEFCVFSFEEYVPLYNLIQCKDDFAPC